MERSTEGSVARAYVQPGSLLTGVMDQFPINEHNLQL